MRILHIVDTLAKGSGVMELLMSYNRVMNDVIFDFIFYKEVPNSYKKEIIDLGGVVYEQKEFSSLLKSGRNNKSIHMPDIIHMHVTLFMNYFYHTIGSRLKTPIIGHAHSTELSNSMIKQVRNKLLIFNSYKKYDYYWGCSELAIERWFGANSLKHSNSWVMPNAIECSEIKRTIKRHNDYTKSNGNYILGTVGRLSVEKNHSYLINMLPDIIEENSNIELRIIGDGPEKVYINQLIEEKNLSKHVHLLGNLDKSDLFNQMCNFDLFLFPSVFEGFGTALVEAQAFSIPSISNSEVPNTTDLGFVKYITIDEKNGWITEIKHQLKNKTKIEFNEDVNKKGYCIETSADILKLKYKSLISEKV